MSLPAGARLGPYEVIALIGAGGMGEVYRAHDSRLQRDVAIKILSAAVTADAIRRARFEREAKAVSRLNHPNICAVYDVGTQDGMAYLVMEYIEGESLAQCLRRGPISPATAVRLAIQIAAGLDAAHRRGVIHRDLKPTNVIVANQIVKLLDFGLAKLHSNGDPGQAASFDSTLSLNAERCVIGTLHYMAPEQLQGREADPRTDIFAFGTVLQEMLTGRRAFDGDTAASVIAAILTTEPPPVSSSAARDSVASPALDHVVRRALAKDPDERWQTARDVMNELQWILESSSRPPMVTAPSHVWNRRIAWSALGAVALLGWIATSSTLWRMNRTDRAPIHLSFVRPIAVELSNTGRPVLAISPDGTKIVFNANSQLYLRTLDAAEAVPISGTEGNGVQTPFFSPDGQWVAFFSVESHELKRIPAHGGAAITISQPPAGSSANFGANWTADDQVLFATPEGVFRVSANGGTPQKIIDARPGETLHGPQMLPDRDHVLLSVTTATGANRWDKAHIIAQSLSSGARTVLIEPGADARYLDTGHIVYAIGTTLFAVPVDLRALRTLKPPTPVLRDIRRSAEPAVNTGSAFVDISKSGDLAYIPAATDSWINVSVDLAGHVTPLPDRDVRAVCVSPDGSQMIAVHENAWWLYSLTRRAAPRRITTAEGTNTNPLWTPDGTRIIFRSRRESSSAIVSRPADGIGPEELLLPLDGSPVGWSPDGKTLFYIFEKQIWSWTRGAQPQSLAAIDAPYASLSPDRNWVAFHTYDQGRSVPYIQSLSPPSARFRVSADGGHAPLWSPNGKKLFYVSKHMGSLLAVDVQTRPTVVFGDPVVLVPEILHGPMLSHRWYDITPDARRLLLQVPTHRESREVYVILRWTQELKRLVPTH